MKIKSVETCRLTFHPLPKTPARRPSYNKLVKRVHPINRYPEFPRGQGRIPGQSNRELWVKITAEDGTFGLGTCRWGDVVDPLIKNHLAPLVVGKDAFALEFINDVLWRAMQRTGPTGLTTIARSAIDLALWDLKGKLPECTRLQPHWRSVPRGAQSLLHERRSRLDNGARLQSVQDL